MKLTPKNQYPIVLVHGLLGWGPDELAGVNYWHGFDCQRGAPGIIEAEVSAVASLHDRACELFYQLVGGQVDYGQAHADAFGHQRFGRDYKLGRYPQWSAERPLHFVGHSMGAPTIRMLQHLLEKKAFAGFDTDHRWVRSVATVSGVNNGSTAVYLLGADQTTGLLKKRSPATALIKWVELYSALAPAAVKRFYDFDLDHWGLRRAEGEPLGDYLKRLWRLDAYRSGKDNPAWDLSIQGLLHWNKQFKTWPDTFYFGFATQQTIKLPFGQRIAPSLRMNPLLYIPSAWMANARFKQPFYTGFKPSEWRHNDGLVPTYSQQFPRIGGHHPHRPWCDCDEIEPGFWHDMPLLEDWDHVDIVVAPELRQLKGRRRFYAELFELLRATPA